MAFGPQTPSTKPDNAKLVGGISSWITCSIGMMGFNKLAVQAVPQPCFLVAIQMGFTVLVMLCCWSSLHIGSKWDALRWCCVVPFFLGMLLTSLFALKYAPMSLVVTFRALSPFFSLIIERIFFAKPPEGTLLSFWPLLVIVMGAALYARDVKHTSDGLLGIFWVLLNTVMALGDRLLQRRMLAPDESPVDISNTGVTLLNNLLSMIPLFFIAFFNGEFKQVPDSLDKLDKLGWFYLLASCLVGVGISFTGILVQGMISATSFLVLVNANKFVIIIIEVSVMSKALTQLQVVGAALTIAGSCFWGCRGNDCSRTCTEVSTMIGLHHAHDKPDVQDTKEGNENG